ncbi:hypothetical protein V6Z12_A06G149900 [Gossypium hirsutum]
MSDLLLPLHKQGFVQLHNIMARERRNHPITKKGRAIELRRIKISRVRSSHAQGSPSERYHERILKNQVTGLHGKWRHRKKFGFSFGYLLVISY